MSYSQVTVRLVALLFFTYWSFFFGAEIVSTIQLYQKGNDIYHALLNNTHADTAGKDDNGVPLIMHRMWKDDHIMERDNPELPASWAKAFASCSEQYRRRNWTTILWTDDSICMFMEKHYPSFVPVYDSYPYDIQRVDAARYFILYHYGGERVLRK